MKIADVLKEIFEENGLVLIDKNYYETQPNFNKKFEKLIDGRKVAIGYLSNKINIKMRKHKTGIKKGE